MHNYFKDQSLLFGWGRVSSRNKKVYIYRPLPPNVFFHDTHTNFFHMLIYHAELFYGPLIMYWAGGLLVEVGRR